MLISKLHGFVTMKQRTYQINFILIMLLLTAMMVFFLYQIVASFKNYPEPTLAIGKDVHVTVIQEESPIDNLYLDSRQAESNSLDFGCMVDNDEPRFN